ncbi:MAG: cytochrome P450 [Oceanisphaera sp.]
MSAKQVKQELTLNNDVRALTDTQRISETIVQNEAGDYILLRHDDVVNAALDDERFSSQVSRFVQIPNGLDGQEHNKYRQLIDCYLSAAALTPFITTFSQVANDLVRSLPTKTVLNAVSDIGAVFAVRAQCAWLGWPAELEPTLLQWMRDNHSANRAQNNSQMATVAQDFDQIIRSVIEPRRHLTANRSLLDTDDVTSRLCKDTVDGRLLTESELISILRNWTGGDLGSLALCVGVIVAYLVKHPAYAQRLSHAPGAELDAAIDEILRIDDPFVSNRRITRCPVTIGKHVIPSGARVHLNWTSANRDQAVFGDNQFAPNANAAHNLVYGVGKHVCPGRLLSSLQLRVITQALLTQVSSFTQAPKLKMVREQAPLGGYNQVPVILTAHAEPGTNQV